MPVMNGIEAMIEILQADKSVKIIFSSADVTVKEQALSRGAIAFLKKPFNIQDLIEIIQKLVNNPLND